RRVEVDELGDGGGWFAIPLRSRGVHEQRRPAGALEECILIPPVPHAKLVPVVADEDDDRAVGQLQPVESGEQLAELGVQERHPRIVRPQELALLRVAELIKGSLECSAWEAVRIRQLVAVGRSGKGELVKWIQVEILLRALVRIMRPI